MAGMVSCSIKYVETAPRYGMFMEKLMATHGLQQLYQSNLLISTQIFDLAEPRMEPMVKAIEPVMLIYKVLDLQPSHPLSPLPGLVSQSV